MESNIFELSSIYFQKVIFLLLYIRLNIFKHKIHQWCNLVMFVGWRDEMFLHFTQNKKILFITSPFQCNKCMYTNDTETNNTKYSYYLQIGIILYWYQ
jgi:hypothetical protein